MAATLASPESADTGWQAVQKHAFGARTFRVLVASAALLVFTNGPVLLFSKSVLNRSSRWEDLAVWPFLAAAALCGAALATREVVAARGRSLQTFEQIAAMAAGWFALAALASSLWSVDPTSTAWRSSIYVGMALLAWAIARFDRRDTAATIGLVATAAVGASLLLVALRPDLGIGPNDYWEGVYTNRNSLAPLAAIGVLAGVRFAVGGSRSGRIAAVGLVAASTAALIGAGSRTAWISLIVAGAASSLPPAHHWIEERWGRRRAKAVTLTAAGAGATGAIACLIAVWDVPTLSQRRTIWSLVWDRILQRPWAGHGFFTFWDIEELTQHVLLRRGSAHNSLVEVGLGLGLLGAVPFAAIVVLAARNAGLALWRRPGVDTWMWAALVAFLLMENVTESFVLWFSYSWVLLMAAALKPVPQANPATDSGSALSTRIPRSGRTATSRPASRADDGSEPTPETRPKGATGRLRSGWTAVALISLSVLALWMPDLDLPLGNSDDGRIVAFSGLKAHNFWDLGPPESDWGARVDPFIRAEFDVPPRSDPPIEAVTYAHHPPLKDWLSIGSTGVLGESLAALRIPAFLMGAATLVFMASLLRACGLRWGPVLLSIGAMACTGFFYVYGRLGVSFSLLVASAAAVAWLRQIEQPSRRALVGTAVLAALAAMHSWIALASLGLLAVWLFASRLQRSATEGGRLRLKSVLARGWSSSLTALVVGGAAGAAITAVWILSATGFSELVDRFAFRFGNDVSTAIEQRRFSFGEFLARQWDFASHELLAPLWLRALLLPALVAGLVDRRTRVPTLITLASAATLTFGFQQGAWIHRLWNFPWLAPATIGLAALFDAGRRGLRGRAARLRLPAGVLAATVAAATLLAVITGSTRDFYLSDPAEAGAILEEVSDSRTPEVVWIAPGISTARWASYYLGAPVFALDEDWLDRVAPSDLVLVRSDRVPDYLPDSALREPIATGGAYMVLDGAMIVE